MNLRDRIINLSQLLCYKCGLPLGNRTAMYDPKTKTGKGWRHEICPPICGGCPLDAEIASKTP